jgi:radical SAM-linked protein
MWYTEGFNPKPKMIFAAPLSIGTESVCEYMDLRMNEYIDPAVAMARINANMTHEMQITEAYYPESKFTDLKWMSYRITIRPADFSDELVERINLALNSDVIEVQKKNSEDMMNIRPLIKAASAVGEGESIVISAVLSADPSAFLNPEYLIKAVRHSCGILTSENLMGESYEIMRLCAYFDDMTEFR